MIIYENECVGCPTEMGCMGKACPYNNVPHVHCDNCDCEADIFYAYEGEYFCRDCYVDMMLDCADTYTAEEIIERDG